MRVPIDSIKVGERKRRVDDVSDLVESIAQLGLLQPIVITQDYELIAGERRLKACKQLGWTEIEATVATLDDLSAELAEIDENIVRQELTVLERAEQLARRKEIYETLHPETRHGGAPGKPGGGKVARAKDDTVSSFASDTAAKTGLSPRSVQRDVQIAMRIAPDVRDAIRETPIADSKRDLLELARKEPEEQRKIVQKVLDGTTDKVKIASQIVKYESLPLPPPTATLGEYDVILADPPWRYDFVEAPNRAIENHYPTMTLDEIKSLKIPAAKDAVLFLWATAPLLKSALEVMEAWGFTYHTCAVWDKEKIGMGYWFRVQHELLLLGIKGNVATPPPNVRVSSVIRSTRQEHSRKPDIVYEIIENMFPNARLLELFARRNNRERWNVWGNET
jgi:N6-adenosine-specific RNA methylase IME4